MTVTHLPFHLIHNRYAMVILDITGQPCSRIVIYPGEKVILPVCVVGQYFGTISGTVLVHVEGEATIDNNETAQTVNIPEENITYIVYSNSNDQYINKQIICWSERCYWFSRIQSSLPT